MNDSVSYSELRKTLKNSLDRVCENHEPLLVKRQHGGDIVILSKNDYTSLAETAYLLQSPANARRLEESLKSKKNIKFANLKELTDELGLQAERL
jgi:antitoxin YefM